MTCKTTTGRPSPTTAIPATARGSSPSRASGPRAERWAKANGYTIVREYADRAMTGTNDDREQFQLMLRELERLRPAVLILWKVDRMGRNKEEIAFNKYRCKKNGVKVIYTAESIPDTPEGVILESVLEGMAEYYSLQLSQNVRRGLTGQCHEVPEYRGQPATRLSYRTGQEV
ncbi:MAG: recombinase family protein [Evtepia sp.]